MHIKESRTDRLFGLIVNIILVWYMKQNVYGCIGSTREAPIIGQAADWQNSMQDI